MTPYQYQPLDTKAGYIRLIYLLPAEFTADIRVDIVQKRLEKEDVPKYEALSYAWGESDTPEVIYVGHKGDITLAVTRSLYQALPYLRYRDQERVLWIDAICVDQQNLEERGPQVERMGDIYSLADRVIVWLGPEDSTSVHAIHFLRTIASKVEVDWVTSTMKPLSQDDADWVDVNKAHTYSKPEVFAICALVMRPWFERLWVQQEIRANRNAVLICGSDTLSWQEFRRAFFCFYYKWGFYEDGKIIDPAFSAREVLVYRTIREGGDSTLGQLIERTQLCKCSDSRDRVYGVLNMPKRFERGAEIKPDYTKTVSQVYRDVVTSMLDHTHKITILEYCEMQEQPLEPSDSLKLPSWVPNWTIPRFTNHIHSGNTSGNSNAETSYDNDVLKIMGTQVARISHVKKIMCHSTTDLIPAIQNFSQEFLPDVKSASYISGGSKLDAYCRTLCGNFFDDEYIPAQAFMPNFQQSREWLSSIINPQGTGIASGANLATGYREYTSCVWDFCNRKSLFTTEEGYIGHAPRAAKAGDLVCVLLGSRSPFLLRPLANNQYQLVGHCCAHGIMNGEALLGPLPGDYHSIYTLEREDNFYTQGFHSPEKDIIQYNDPRLPFKPVHELSERQFEWVREEQNALTSEALKKRGVHMEMFELV